MRFFEHESREIVRRAGIPTTKFAFATSAEEAKKAAEEIGGPVVIKSQVLTGGRMKAGGVQFADTPEEAATKAEQVLGLVINDHMPRGVMVDTRADVAQEYYAGVVWDGTRKLPVIILSDMGGIDIEEVAEPPPEHEGRRHFSTRKPFDDYEAKELVASLGITGPDLNRLTPIIARLARLFLEDDMTLGETNPLRRLADAPAVDEAAGRGRGKFVALDAHMDMENE